MARTEIRSVVERIRRQLNGAFRYEVSQLGSSALDTDTVLTLAYALPPSLIPGAVVSIGTETCRVLDVDANAREITVIRGWYDSIPQVHADTTEVWINPRFTATDIFEAMHDELASWPVTLYRVVGGTFPVGYGQQTLELPALWRDAYGIIDVRRQWGTSIGSMASSAWPRLPARVQRGDDWGDVTSGIHLRFTEGVHVGNVYVQAGLPFDLAAFDYASDLVVDVGLAASMLDVLTMGVKMRLLIDNEADRSSRRAQDDSRRAEETPPEAALTSMRVSYPLYLRRRTEEAHKIQALYPIRYT
jgi:hypothetical protein